MIINSADTHTTKNTERTAFYDYYTKNSQSIKF